MARPLKSSTILRPIKLYSYPTLSELDSCPYLEGHEVRFRYFFAEDLDEEEWEYFLASGFRKFGHYIFKPECPSCQKCQPLRVLVKEFTPSKSQRRILKKNKNTRMEIKNLIYQREIYDLYCLHSEAKFDTDKHPVASEEEFLLSHFTKTSPALLTEYRFEDILIAVGFLDVSHQGLSSVYFIYHPDFAHLGLGTYGALKEIELAKEMEKQYYYLGYYIEENRSMNYKANYRPFQLLKKDKWIKK